jgi:hypothetical protein
VFYAKGWRLLGTKSSFVKHVAQITGIDELTLLEPKLIHNASVAQRMSWAANRTTTRTEDLAYSLLGIFGVNMPIIYGEGKNAFLRLQEEIIKRSDDHSIFAWGTLGHDEGQFPHHHHVDLDDIDYEDLAGTTSILATCPKDFAGLEHVITAPPQTQNTTDYAMTNKGLHINLPLTRTHPRGHTTATHLAILNCHTEHSPSTRLALLLTETSTPNVFLRTRSRTPTLVSAADVASAKPKLIYIPNTPAHVPRSTFSEEIILIRAPDLVAPGYDVLDIQGSQAQWNREFRSIRLAGVDYQYGNTKRGGVLYQLAVITFWNKHLKCGFVVRVLVHGGSKVLFVDLLQGLQENGKGGEEGKGLVEEAKRVWETPGTVEVNVTGRGGGSAPRRMQVEVVNAGGQIEEERETMAGKSRVEGRGWEFRAGHEVGVSGSVTFTETWERDYQRTVNAKVERKKKGVIELNMSTLLWQAPKAKVDELDQPS